MSENDRSEKEWLRQYDVLAARFEKLFRDAKAHGGETMNAALDKAKAELIEAKEFTAERGEQLRQYLAQDLEQIVEAARDLGDAARQDFDPERYVAGARASLATVLERAGKAIVELGHKAREPITCKTGEITSAGTLTCQRCGEQLHFEKTGRIPPCPKCKGTVFIKSF